MTSLNGFLAGLFGALFAVLTAIFLGRRPASSQAAHRRSRPGVHKPKAEIPPVLVDPAAIKQATEDAEKRLESGPSEASLSALEAEIERLRGQK